MAGAQTRGSRGGKADRSGPPTATDRRQARSRQRERDAPLEAAYNAGRRGDDPAEYQTSDELYGYYQDGAAAAKEEARAGRREQRVEGLRSQAGAAGAKAGNVANDGAGFLLGLFAYALLANYLRNGVPGMRGWLAAKFLNRPMDSSGVSKPAAAGRPG